MQEENNGGGGGLAEEGAVAHVHLLTQGCFWWCPRRPRHWAGISVWHALHCQRGRCSLGILHLLGPHRPGLLLCAPDLFLLGLTPRLSQLSPPDLKADMLPSGPSSGDPKMVGLDTVRRLHELS